MKKIWKLKDLVLENGTVTNRDFDSFQAEMMRLKAKVQLPELMLRLLYMRGITNYDKLVKFFKPIKDKLYDPLLLKDCDIAADRILKTINEKEKILILGDYDVDGTCGVSMFYLFLKHFNLDSVVYIPDRIKEGYGVSKHAINKAVEENIKLIVTIDCGITAVEQADYAKTQGCEMIVCDHHQPPDSIPDALAVLDPLRRDCNYPYKHLCGTGVAFKLIQAVCNKLSEKDFAYTLLDFVSIATSSDIVPITDENRILVSEGFELIKTKPRPAIKTLLDTANVKNDKINTSMLVYMVAPRINAVGRLGDAKRAVELLTSENPEELDELASILEAENDNRREIDKGITDDAFKSFEEIINPENYFSIILHNDDWHPGVIGIVAARLVEKYHLPSIVLTTVNGIAKGSARSIDGFNIYDALKKCEEYLIQFGGHYHAAGLEIEPENIEKFKKAFNEIASREFMQKHPVPLIEVDMEIGLNDITPKLSKLLTFFEPYGPGNLPPTFITKNVKIVGEPRWYDKSNTHLFKVKDEETNKVLDAVFFGSNDYRNEIVTGQECDICYTIEKSNWNNIETTKLKIRDLKPV